MVFLAGGKFQAGQSQCRSEDPLDRTSGTLPAHGYSPQLPCRTDGGQGKQDDTPVWLGELGNRCKERRQSHARRIEQPISRLHIPVVTCLHLHTACFI